MLADASGQKDNRQPLQRIDHHEQPRIPESGLAGWYPSHDRPSWPNAGLLSRDHPRPPGGRRGRHEQCRVRSRNQISFSMQTYFCSGHSTEHPLPVRQTELTAGEGPPHAEGRFLRKYGLACPFRHERPAVYRPVWFRWQAGLANKANVESSGVARASSMVSRKLDAVLAGIRRIR